MNYPINEKDLDHPPVEMWLLTHNLPPPTPPGRPRGRRFADILSPDEEHPGIAVFLAAAGTERFEGLPRASGAHQHGSVPLPPGEVICQHQQHEREKANVGCGDCAAFCCRLFVGSDDEQLILWCICFVKSL